MSSSHLEENCQITKESRGEAAAPSVLSAPLELRIFLSVVFMRYTSVFWTYCKMEIYGVNG